jgi:hypothetical protein
LSSIVIFFVFYFRLYQKIFEQSYGAATGEKMLQDVEKAIQDYNREQVMECGKMETINGKVVIALCTPLMRRVHIHHQCSGELVFVDASGGMDRYDCRVFLILTHSSAGGLPLGCLITTSESREAITLALKLYNDLIPSNGYFGRGTKGPVVFITDDSDSERQSLREVYPEATLVLCVFHLLQATWRFVWEARNGVKKEDRPHLLALVKSMVYALNEEGLQGKFNTLCGDSIAKKYVRYVEYCEKMYERRRQWAVCYRKELPMRGNDTNNYVESAMRVLKDHIFDRVRAYNVTQLIDFLLTRLPSYYERRLIDLANGKTDVFVAKRFLPGGEGIAKDSIVQTATNAFQVRSESDKDKMYDVHVDKDLSMCSCFKGFNGAPCKHQFAVLKHFGVSSMNFLPRYDERLRKHLLFLATGSKNVPEGWFAPLPTAACAQFAVPFEHNESNSVSVIESRSSNGPDVTGDVPCDLVESLNAQRHMQNIFDGRSNINSVSACTSQPTERLEDDVKDFSNELIGLLRKDPESYRKPVKVFLQQFHEQKTDNAIISALTTFGKYTGAAASLTNNKKKHAAGRRRGVMIKVQPTAVSRRVSALGGRRALHTGRKRKENAENSPPVCPSKESVHLIPKKRPRRAPHNLSQCLKNIENIGKNHASKW